MTKVFVQSWGWVYLHLVKDWGSKKIVGWQLSARSKTKDWLEALKLALNAQFPDGVREATDGQLKLVSDNGYQPTSTGFMAACSVLEVEQTFTSFNDPKGNADTERVFRTMKEDLIWLQEWTSFQQLYKALKQWIEDYNTDFPHSSLPANTSRITSTTNQTNTRLLNLELSGGTTFLVIMAGTIKVRALW